MKRQSEFGIKARADSDVAFTIWKMLMKNKDLWSDAEFVVLSSTDIDTIC